MSKDMVELQQPCPAQYQQYIIILYALSLDTYWRKHLLYKYIRILWYTYLYQHFIFWYIPVYTIYNPLISPMLSYTYHHFSAMTSTIYDIGYDFATDIPFDINNFLYHSPLISEFSCYRIWYHGTCTTGWRCLRPPRACCSTSESSCLPIACKAPMHRSHWSFQYGLGVQVGVV